ncbi:MAG: hypothetical protein ACAH12_02185 [Methylophilaceae bacterium]
MSKHIGILLALTLDLILTACSVDPNPAYPILKEIKTQRTTSSEHILDFRNMADAEWIRVCFFGPYSVNTSQVLGLNWELSDHVSISDESVLTIVFASDTKVTEYAVNPRSNGDFSRVSGMCFLRKDALFVLDEMGKYIHKIDAVTTLTH